MTSRMKYGSIAKALFLLALGVALLLDSTNYGQEGEQPPTTQEQPPETFVKARTVTNGGLNAQIMPGVNLAVDFVVDCSDPDPLKHRPTANREVMIWVTGTPGQPLTAETITSIEVRVGDLYQQLPSDDFTVATSGGRTTITPKTKTSSGRTKICLYLWYEFKKIRRDVEVKRAGTDEWVRPKPGEFVAPRDQIRTGKKSGALMVSPPSLPHRAANMLIILSASTHTTMRGGIHLWEGPLLMLLGPYPRGSGVVEDGVEIMTPIGTAAVRGTLFRVSHDPEQEVTEVTVVRGVVEVSTLPTGKNRVTLTGPGSCAQGGLRVMLDREERISTPELIQLDLEEWRMEFDDGSIVDLCAAERGS